ncbi:uncharacterized protein LOC112681614 [Sipha flava]|uniref:Uncharacterized protein LOC112681614 n=1 Tax=Sipha flava TaxID=143950 RepID=A0A8B8FAK7_9HEMI|nr:uncharacterized protein LOC112681614 [Sipha flava]
MLWVGYPKDEPQTTNGVEAFHRHFIQQFYTPHPHIHQITGAARGIGRELAFRFSKLGAKIACLDVDEIGNRETATIIKENGGTAADYKCDVTKKDQVKNVHKKVVQDLGPVDILINNAAIVWGYSYIHPFADQFIEDLINVNLMGQFWVNREILPSMLERNSGHIVSISSLSSMRPVLGASAYTTSKCAINGMMECMESELKYLNSNLRTTTILPYFVKTNPKITARLHIRLSEIPTEIAVDEMMKGILEERRVFSIPGLFLPIVSFVRLLPDDLQNVFNKITDIRITLDEYDLEIFKKIYS